MVPSQDPQRDPSSPGRQRHGLVRQARPDTVTGTGDNGSEPTTPERLTVPNHHTTARDAVQASRSPGGGRDAVTDMRTSLDTAGA